MITLNRNIIYPFIALLTVVVGIFTFFTNETNYLTSFITFAFLVIVPGFLIMESLAFKHIRKIDIFLLSIGFSLLFLIIPGIIHNSLWQVISKVPPLQIELLAVIYGSLLLILLVTAYQKGENLLWTIKFSFAGFIKSTYYIFPPLITVFSVFGAFSLNNNGSNFFAVFTLSAIAIATFITITLHKKIDANFLPWSLYFYSLALLLSLSLRSLYVSGWDIQSEFFVFQLTKNLGFWSPYNLNDAYNACLSITLLPTIISKFTQFPDDYIYKIFYQLLFAFTPIIVFQLFKRYALSIVAFISIIYIISQPLFIQPMTALMRQEIAFIFFALMIYVMFNPNLSTIKRLSISSLFGIGMILSHYSTTYITLLLFLLSYPFVLFIQLTERVPLLEQIYRKIKLSSSIKFYQYYLNPLLLLILFVFTFFWYGLINNQLGQVQRVASEGLTRMNELFKTDITSGESKQAIPFAEKNFTNTEQLTRFIEAQLIKVGGDSYRLYPEHTYRNSNVVPLTAMTVPPMILSSFNKHIIIILELLKQILKVCVMISPLYIFVMYFRKNTIPRDYIVISGISVFIIVIMTFHPYFGRQYNLSRFYLQLLFFLSLPTMLFLLFVFYPLKKFGLIFVGVIVTCMFIYLTGLSYQFLGGEARMYLNNYGPDYNKFYVHQEELTAAEWLDYQVSEKDTLFMDQEANLRVFRVVSRSFNRNVLPALIYKDAYVYGSYANVVNNRSIIYTDTSSLEFTFPKKFLHENKNVIYSNGGSEIYR